MVHAYGPDHATSPLRNLHSPFLGWMSPTTTHRMARLPCPLPVPSPRLHLRHGVTDARTVEHAHPPRPRREHGIAHSRTPPFERRPVHCAKRTHRRGGASPCAPLPTADSERRIAIPQRLEARGTVVGRDHASAIGAQEAETSPLHLRLRRHFQPLELGGDLTAEAVRAIVEVSMTSKFEGLWIALFAGRVALPEERVPRSRRKTASPCRTVRRRRGARRRRRRQSAASPPSEPQGRRSLTSSNACFCSVPRKTRS
jgi:hypothetical protein